MGEESESYLPYTAADEPYQPELRMTFILPNLYLMNACLNRISKEKRNFRCR